MPNIHTIILIISLILILHFGLQNPFRFLFWVSKPVTFLFCAIDIHLALCTVEFQSESSAIAQLQEQRLLPLRLLASSFYTTTQRVADAMAALHDE